MKLFVILVSVISLLSLPVMYITQSRTDSRGIFRRIHGVMLAAGVLCMAAVPIIFEWKVSSAAEGIRGWANDFFYSYFTPAIIWFSVTLAILCGAASVRHHMRRIRMIIAAVLPFVMAALTAFAASVAEGGYFAVDFYIAALVPGFGFLVHAVPLCERSKKKKKKRKK